MDPGPHGHPDQVAYIITWEDLVRNPPSWVKPFLHSPSPSQSTLLALEAPKNRNLDPHKPVLPDKPQRDLLLLEPLPPPPQNPLLGPPPSPLPPVLSPALSSTASTPTLSPTSPSAPPSTPSPPPAPPKLTPRMRRRHLLVSACGGLRTQKALPLSNPPFSPSVLSVYN
ncbi:uncharacterized protein [Macaca nemestrina]|uniref:uncharacterized protein n=1 Tax=Macaca nemestrina TaxID=9545 RepID=UPI0039B9535F